MPRIAEGEDALPPGQGWIVSVGDRIPRQPGQEEENPEEPQPKEHPQSLGHPTTVRLRTRCGKAHDDRRCSQARRRPFPDIVSGGKTPRRFRRAEATGWGHAYGP